MNFVVVTFMFLAMHLAAVNHFLDHYRDAPERGARCWYAECRA